MPSCAPLVAAAHLAPTQPGLQRGVRMHEGGSRLEVAYHLNSSHGCIRSSDIKAGVWGYGMDIKAGAEGCGCQIWQQ